MAWKLTRTEAWVRVGDPELHHAFRAMSHQTEQYGPEQGQIFINSLGAKDDFCREVPPLAGGARVAVFGDSFAEGWGLPFSETVPGQLRGLLASQGVDVLGFGIASHCPSLTERWMRKLIREGVKWDLALLLIDSGDSYDEKEVKPFLDGAVTKKINNTPQFLRLRWYEYSLTYQTLHTLRGWLDSSNRPALNLQKAVKGNQWKVAWLDDESANPWFRRGLEQSASAVQGMQAIAAQQRFALILVVYPYPKMMADGKIKNAYIDFWTDFARENHLPLIDLSPLFAADKQTVEKVYETYFIPGDFHWNAHGSARIADTLLPFIMKNLNARKPAPDNIGGL